MLISFLGTQLSPYLLACYYHCAPESWMKNFSRHMVGVVNPKSSSPFIIDYWCWEIIGKSVTESGIAAIIHRRDYGLEIGLFFPFFLLVSKDNTRLLQLPW